MDGTQRRRGWKHEKEIKNGNQRKRRKKNSRIQVEDSETNNDMNQVHLANTKLTLEKLRQLSGGFIEGDEKHMEENEPSSINRIHLGGTLSSIVQNSNSASRNESRVRAMFSPSPSGRPMYRGRQMRDINGLIDLSED